MSHLKSTLTGLAFVLVLILGGVGTAAASGDTGAGHGISALGGPGSDVLVRSCDGDKDDG